jgi:hypothetical protein
MGQSDRAQEESSAGGWDATVRRLDSILPDGKLLEDVVAFLQKATDAVPGGEKYASPEQIYIQEKILVSSKELKDGVVLYATFCLGPSFSAGGFTGMSVGGVLKVMYDGEGTWLDEFYTPGPWPR